MTSRSPNTIAFSMSRQLCRHLLEESTAYSHYEVLAKDRVSRSSGTLSGGGCHGGVLWARILFAKSKTCSVGKAVVGVEPSGVTKTEDCFNESIKIAQRQKTKSLELRAVTSVARLYQNQDRRKEARDLLARVYDRFTEGFDTMDLREAKALLDELS
jgi:hypothetical protein